MSYTHLRTVEIAKSKKEYHCHGCYTLLNTFDNEEEIKECLTEDQYEYFLKMKAKDFKINVGDPYIKILGIFDGDFGTYRVNREINDILETLEL